MSLSTGKRGRTPIPKRWIQVISLECHDLENLKTHILATILLIVKEYYPPTQSLIEEWHMPVFCPKTFVKENEDISLKQFVIGEDRLLDLGREGT